MEKLNFSWVIPLEIAGHGAPVCKEDLYYLKSKGVKALVRMIEPHKAKLTHGQIEGLGLADLHEHVSDYTAPTQRQIDTIIDFINNVLAETKPVGVSCGFGLGRTGTILACYLVSRGSPPDEAIDKVRSKRPVSIETIEQVAAVQTYATRRGKNFNVQMSMWEMIQ